MNSHSNALSSINNHNSIQIRFTDAKYALGFNWFKVEMKQTNGQNDEPKTNMGLQLLIAGSAACFADFATFPLDTAKVRLQLQGESSSAAPVARSCAIPSKIATTVTTPRPPLTLNSPSAFLAVQRGFNSPAVPIEVPQTTAAPNKFQYRGLFGTITTVARQEGPRALYNGLSAGLQRQMVFASVRLGMYESIKGTYQRILNERPDGLQVLTRVLAGLTTGSMAVMVGQPTEVVKIRFQAQKRVPGACLQYTSTLAAYKKIGREEGVRGLWKGALPNMGRNAIVNVAEIVVYDIVKDCLLLYGNMRDNIYCHFSSAVVAGKCKSSECKNRNRLT